MIFEELDADNQAEVRDLILDGLSRHWGQIDESLNSDLNDMMSTYRHGRTVLVRGQDGALLGTGTIVPRANLDTEILRMSVTYTDRGAGIGRQIVEELLVTARSWGASRVVLETTSSWIDVVAFYTRCGFDIIHTEPGEFGDNTWFEFKLAQPAVGDTSGPRVQ